MNSNKRKIAYSGWVVRFPYAGCIVVVTLLIGALLIGCPDDGGPKIDRETEECTADINTPCSATVGTLFEGTLADADDVDWIKIAFAAMTTYRVELTAGSQTIAILDNGGAAATPAIGSDELYTPQTADDYIVALSGTAGDYTLSVAAAPEGASACNGGDREGDCDGDTILNGTDNCPLTDNELQEDTGETPPDGVGNACDVDDDNDGLIEIATAAELNNVRNDLDGSHYDTSTDDSAQSAAGCPSGGCNGYELMADIDLATIANWAPIGDEGTPFTANFDGNGNTISNLTINTAAGTDIGLFGMINVRNTIRTIRNLHVAGTITYTGSQSIVRIGGLVGYTLTTGATGGMSAIDGCSSAVNITGGGGASQEIGGLVGQSSFIVQNSWATGAIKSCDDSGGTCSGGGSIGGLAGNSAAEIRNSWASGVVSNATVTSSGIVGGLAGETSGAINNSYATGTVTGGSGNDTVGGLVGRLVVATISNSYATGAVSDGDTTDTAADGAEHLGGLIAQHIASTLSAVETSYYSGAVSGITGGGVSAMALGSMQTESALQTPTAVGGIYSTWSANDWDFGVATDFPALKSYKVDGAGTQIAGDLLCGQPSPRAGAACP